MLGQQAARLAETAGIRLHVAAAERFRDLTDVLTDRFPAPACCLPPAPAPAASSIIFDQAENRMHAQNGIMLHAMGVA